MKTSITNYYFQNQSNNTNTIINKLIKSLYYCDFCGVFNLDLECNNKNYIIEGWINDFNTLERNCRISFLYC